MRSRPLLGRAGIAAGIAVVAAVGYALVRLIGVSPQPVPPLVVQARLAPPVQPQRPPVRTRLTTRRQRHASGAPGAAASWVATVSSRTGIPARALQAYADAQLILARREPACHLSWIMLAGIGDIESANGTFDGSELRADGRTTVRILGPALDGTHGNRAIAATSAGVRLDGDPRWDHAVGPMQFTPSTWALWGTSVHNRTPDPNDIDDAALTAGEYLCADGRDLATAAGWRAAVASYNAPVAYAVDVTDAANRYAQASRG